MMPFSATAQERIWGVKLDGSRFKRSAMWHDVVWIGRLDRGSHRRLDCQSRAWLHRRSVGGTADDQRLLSRSLSRDREQREGKIQITFRTPPTSGAPAHLPRQRCRGLIEATTPRTRAARSIGIFRGSDAAASLKRPGVLVCLCDFAPK